MIKVSAAEFQRNIGRYQDLALTQPVAVTRNGRERTVMISTEEYHRLKRRDRQVLRLEDFTDEMIAEIEKAEPPEEAKRYDHEYDTVTSRSSFPRPIPGLRNPIQLPLGRGER